MTVEGSRRSLESWAELLKDSILVSDVNKAVVVALCGHLADLKVLEKTGGEDWELTYLWDDSLTIEQKLKQRLRDICTTESGFAIRYFLNDPPVANKSQEQESSDVKVDPKKNPQLLDQKTSNLSNLQLVNKYGRQVESFIELEKNYTERLLGPHTTLKEARKIFNFVLSRMKQKTEPRSWEQLSRRRHK